MLDARRERAKQKSTLINTLLRVSVTSNLLGSFLETPVALPHYNRLTANVLRHQTWTVQRLSEVPIGLV